MKNIITFTLLLIAATATAQSKTQAAQDYLGDRFEKVMPEGKCVWYFQKEAIYTTASAGQTFRNNLTNRWNFQDGMSYGPLVAITIDGKKVPGNTSVKEVASKTDVAATAKPMDVVVQSKADSISYKEKVDQAVNSAEDIYGHIADNGKSTFDAAWKVFDMFRYVIGVVGIGFWFWATFIKVESKGILMDTLVGDFMIRVQQNSSVFLMMICGFYATMYLVKWAFHLSGYDWPVEGKLFVLFLSALALMKLVNWIVTGPLQGQSGNGNNNTPAQPFKQLRS